MVATLGRTARFSDGRMQMRMLGASGKQHVDFKMYQGPVRFYVELIMREYNDIVCT
jgi:hypothetical protein